MVFKKNVPATTANTPYFTITKNKTQLSLEERSALAETSAFEQQSALAETTLEQRSALAETTLEQQSALAETTLEQRSALTETTLEQRRLQLMQLLTASGFVP